ncbi:MFS transporter [Lentisphaera profundi]|uniref:MFS transporter n=1 Tax=Lentisphaera profundi TaxID=1658616 RepID=A0ABY7VP90_9BACT|nr:MFS transporter [Lentisphaera profundi]WDE95524.1 MFS transporter [Lentisphaera profundi]
MSDKISFKEKFGYGLGDLASNLFWMQFIWYLNYFYTDVFGLAPAVLVTLMGVVRIWDGLNDPAVGIIADRTETRWGKFRPYLLFGAVPFGIIGILMFTTPDLSAGGKLTWAYITHGAFVLIYTVVNIPYSSLMGVVSPDSKVRTSFSQWRFVMAFSGGIIVQATTLPMVAHFGSGDTTVIEARIETIENKQVIVVKENGNGASRVEATAKLPGYEEPSTFQKILMKLANVPDKKNEGKIYKSKKTFYINNETYFLESKILHKNSDDKLFLDDKFENEHKIGDNTEEFAKIKYCVEGFDSTAVDMGTVFKKNKDTISDEMIPVDLTGAEISVEVVNEQNGFQWATTVFGISAALMFLITFSTTKERVKPPKQEVKTPLKTDIKDLLTNKPWLILFVLGIITLFHVCLRNGAIMYYFKYVVGNTGIVPLFMLSGTIANLVSLVAVGSLEKYLGKKKGFALLMLMTAGLTFVFGMISPENIGMLFAVNIAINLMFGPTAALVFAMYTDAADYSEWKTGRRATGLVMSACTMAQKFGYTLGGMLTMAVLVWIGFEANTVQSQEAQDGISGMVSWMSAIPCVFGFVLMLFYPLTEDKLKEIGEVLKQRRAKAEGSEQAASSEQSKEA